MKKARGKFVLAVMTLAVVQLCRASDGQDGASPSVTRSGTAEVVTQHYRVDDMFRLENLGHVVAYGGAAAFAPGGTALAFVHARPRASAPFDQWRRYRQPGIEDVWVQLTADSPPINVTEGIKDGSGWFCPQWSPDGAKLAMLSTRENGLFIWVWDVATRQLRKMSRRPVFIADDDDDLLEQPYVWIDPRRLLYAAVVEDSSPERKSTDRPTTMDIAPQEWEKYRRGENTASVLNSGVPLDTRGRRRAQLRLLDMAKDEGIVANDVDSFRWAPSPRGGFLYFLRKEPSRSGLGWTWHVELAGLDGRKLLIPQAPSDVVVDSIRWSPNGAELAFLGYSDPNDHDHVALYRYDFEANHTAAFSLYGLSIGAAEKKEQNTDCLKWAASGYLVVRAASSQDVASAFRMHTIPRRDWWLVSGDGKFAELTEHMKEVPTDLWPIEGGRAFFGVADGGAWRISPDDGKVEELTTGNPPQRITGLVWPRLAENAQPRTGSNRTYDHVIVNTTEGEEMINWRLDFAARKVTRISAPAEGTRLLAFSSESRSVLLYKNDRNGLFLWRLDADVEKPRALLSANLWLRNISDAEFRTIEYTSHGGERVRAGLLFPYPYQPQRKYPLIIVVYLGDVINSRRDGFLYLSVLGGSYGNWNPFNFEVAASHGYAVLFPSMPLNACCTADDTYLKLTNGVMPAVEKAVELGIADPDRLFVMGHSFGGFSTYGLITQTNRFRAAAAIDAGAADPISAFGTFNGSLRYTLYPQEGHRNETEFENGQSRMGSPPWGDWARYTRNSPLLYVQHVQTPLLIFHGDMDFVPMMQAEEFFTALHHDNKRVQFVRYWGEDHAPDNPENIRDMWSRIFAWFDEFGDIQRDVQGNVVLDGDHAKSRNGAPPLKPADFASFDKEGVQREAEHNTDRN